MQLLEESSADDSTGEVPSESEEEDDNELTFNPDSTKRIKLNVDILLSALKHVDEFIDLCSSISIVYMRKENLLYEPHDLFEESDLSEKRRD